MKYVFGKDFNYTFTPYQDGELIESIPTHTASLLVYTSEPSRSQVSAGSGALATYTATWQTNATACLFAITAITDPDPDGSDEDVTYWVGIKFKLKTAGDDQIHISALIIERARGTGSVLSVTVGDIQEQFSAIVDYVSVQDILNQIDIQKLLLRAGLEGKGYDWAQIWQPSKLKQAIVFATLGALLAQESKRDGDQFDKLSKRFDSNGAQFLKVINIEYDANKNNEPESLIAGRGFSVMVR